MRCLCSLASGGALVGYGPRIAILRRADAVLDAEAVSDVPEGFGDVLSVAASANGAHIAALGANKQVACWTVVRNEGAATELRLAQCWKLEKRGTALCFADADGTSLLVTDKSGDLYRFATASQAGGEEVLGCVSMFLDVSMAAGGRLVVTSDRDRRIRMSLYPETYCIYSFALGHTEFVSRAVGLTDAQGNNRLLSTAGDGKLCLWNMQGECLSSADVAGSEGERYSRALVDVVTVGTDRCCVAAPYRQQVTLVPLVSDALDMPSAVHVALSIRPMALAVDTSDGFVWCACRDVSGPIQLVAVSPDGSGSPISLAAPTGSALEAWLSGPAEAGMDWTSLYHQDDVGGEEQYMERKNARLQAKLKKVEEAGEAADAGASTAVSTVKMDIV